MGSVITWLFLIGLIGCQSLPHDSLHPPLGPKTWKKLYRDPETAGGFLNPPTPLKQSKDPSVQQAIVLDKKWYTPISLYTTPTLPIIKVFKQTAQDLGLTLEFSQTEPTYGLDLSINDQPFFHAIQTLCRLSQWRYEATHHKTIVITPTNIATKFNFLIFYAKVIVPPAVMETLEQETKPTYPPRDQG